MKLFATLANIAFIIFVLSLFLGEIGHVDGKGVALFAVLVAFPIVNLVALWVAAGNRSLVALFMERKRLEQEMKIAELRNSAAKKSN